MESRDVRLNLNELAFAKDAMTRRRRELEKRLAGSTFKGKPGMKERVLNDLSMARELESTFEHNYEQARRVAVNVVREKLKMEPVR